MRARASRYSTREVADGLGLCVATVRRLCQRGDLRGTPTGRRGHYWLVYATDLMTWLESESARKVLARASSWSSQSAARAEPPPPDASTDDTTSDKHPSVRARKGKR